MIAVEFFPLKFSVHTDEVLHFCLANKDFFIQYENITPDKSMVQNLFQSVPDGMKSTQKQILGVYQSNKLCALIELIKDRHTKNEWLLSLFVVDNKYRRQGLGKKIIYALELYLVNLGVTCILLGVIEENQIAISFWKNLNYQQHTRMSNPQNINGKLQNIHTFYKEI